MATFKEFVNSEEEKDIQKTIQKLPPSHAALVQGFRWQLQGGNTLSGDNQHVGYMDKGEKEIAVAAPWFYPREFTLLHEIAHLVWERLPEQIKAQWAQLVNNTKREKDAQKQSAEELFSMAYATTYVKHPPTTFAFPKWMQFIKSLPS